ncbi:DegT/DnrJ/EryC1/StrS family aminotransferase [Curtobacterium flaccumfaciens]|uniref:DegT/DnrJ/EryC1/StrS family aminotransferase n=1 Tax=Curtobacterium flaccumfaciens TaxID=2035 RepID=UPI001603A657|nr:DegT/DnrJ/EryC1/StrS family aminotransferase [Curtobacterium flaccumfaciens]MBB1195626.1 DegT/DnrJ/EryC1/StrS family aminotransferase [Curtobacterium flaccumfaciens]
MTPSTLNDSASFVVPQHGQGSGFDEDDVTAVLSLMRSNEHLSSGLQVEAFEREFAAMVGVSHAVAVTSCTTALGLVTRVLDLEDGDEVIAPALTFQATITALLSTGVSVRFAEINPNTLCLDPDSVRSLITSRTRAIFTVHYAGLCAGVDSLRRIADEHGVSLVEDCAHALGGSLSGQSAGAWGDLACWSFHSLKNISTLGQGGMVTTNDAVSAQRIREMRGINPDAQFALRSAPVRFDTHADASTPRPENHEKNAYTHDCLTVRHEGVNATMSEVAAAVGRTQLRRLPVLAERRRQFASLLDDGLRGVPGVRVLEIPEGAEHARHLYAFLLDGDEIDRDELVRRLSKAGIEVVLRYFPLHLLPEWRMRGNVLGQLPVTENVWFRKLVNLPISPQLSDEQAEYMVAVVASVLEEMRRSV